MHNCIDTLTGYYCTCDEGFRLLSNGKTCRGIMYAITVVSSKLSFFVTFDSKEFCCSFLLHRRNVMDYLVSAKIKLQCLLLALHTKAIEDSRLCHSAQFKHVETERQT